MKMRLALLSLATIALASASQNAASAGDITNLIRRPVQAVSPLIPLVDVSTAVPTTPEILAVPVPRRGELRAYPGNVLRYGLNVHPGARIARQNGLLPNGN